MRVSRRAHCGKCGIQEFSLYSTLKDSFQAVFFLHRFSSGWRDELMLQPERNSGNSGTAVRRTGDFAMSKASVCR